MMKKLIVLVVALCFALSLTSMVFAQDKKASTPQPPPGLDPMTKGQIDDTKKKATVKSEGEVKAQTPPGLDPTTKGQIDDTKKKATVKKKKAVKPQTPPGLDPMTKGQIEDTKKPSTVEKMEKKKEAAPVAPAEKK